MLPTLITKYKKKIDQKVDKIKAKTSSPWTWHCVNGQDIQFFFGKFTESIDKSHKPRADETFQNHYEESLQSFVLK